MPERLDRSVYVALVRDALQEDIGSGDLTTRAVVPETARARAEFLVKRACVIAGLPIAKEAFTQLDPEVQFETTHADGDRCDAGTVVATVGGKARGILAAERTALNFVQHLSGIATLTRRFVEAAAGRLTILDTRKTLPLLRGVEKYAVRCGGGTNHRTGLYDGVLIKDNHIRVAGSIAEAVGRVRGSGNRLPIEVEAQSLDDVEQALFASADVIMLDNLDDASMRRAIARIAGRAKVEISGGVTLDRIPALAALGADPCLLGRSRTLLRRPT